MLNVLRLADASVWRELESTENGQEVGGKSKTAVANHFDAELRRREDGHSPLHFYALFRPDGSVPVCLRVGDGPSTSPTGTIVTGVSNSDPYPAYGAAIEALGHQLQVGLGPEMYPYKRGHLR